MKNLKDFKKMYGNEPLTATTDYLSKTIASNYCNEYCFNEFVDNSIDARIGDNEVNVVINYDNDNHVLTIEDNGTGIKDFSCLMKLGGSIKTGDTSNKFIGKYGLGVKGAISAIATHNRFNSNMISVVTFESACNGKMGTKKIAFNNDGSAVIGLTNLSDCDNNIHYTKIIFDNVIINNISDIIDSMEETFELPLLGYNNIKLNIQFNGRHLGHTGRRTFVGDESINTILVGEHKTDVIYRIIGGKTKVDRSFDEAGIRVYDKETGRLLGKSNDYWSWFADKKAQQNICGVRLGMFIESNIKSYNKFGVRPEKSGIGYHKFFKQNDFKDLSNYLKNVYNQAVKTTPNIETCVQKVGSRIFQPVTKTGSNSLYDMVGNMVYYKTKYKPNEIIELINENIVLKNKLEKKNKKSVA